jgi:hypothetical protein
MRDQIQPVLVFYLGENSTWVRPDVMILLVTWVYTFPLTLIRKMSLFGVPSTLSQIGVFYTVIVVVVHCISSDFGANRAIAAGTPLVIETCNAMTEERWRGVSSTNFGSLDYSLELTREVRPTLESLARRSALFDLTAACCAQGSMPLCATYTQRRGGSPVTLQQCKSDGTANQGFVAKANQFQVSGSGPDDEFGPDKLCLGVQVSAPPHI